MLGAGAAGLCGAVGLCEAALGSVGLHWALLGAGKPEAAGVTGAFVHPRFGQVGAMRGVMSVCSSHCPVSGEQRAWEEELLAGQPTPPALALRFTQGTVLLSASAAPDLILSFQQGQRGPSGTEGLKGS